MIFRLLINFYFYLFIFSCICRTVPRTVSFGANIKLLVGFCIFTSEIFYVLVHNEPMNQEKRALLNLMLFTGSLIFILLIEISQLFSHRLTLEERRLVRLVGSLQEALIISNLYLICRSCNKLSTAAWKILFIWFS